MTPDGSPLPGTVPEPGGRARAVLGGLLTACRVLLVVSLAAILLFTVGQVADRYVFGTSFSAYDQISRVGLVWLTFVGFAVGVWERVNIRVEVLDRFLPRRLHDRISIVLDLGMALVAALVLVEGWRLIEVGAYQQIMGTPFTYEIVYAGLLVGLAVLIVFLAARLWGALTGTRLAPEAEGFEHDHR